MNTPSNFDPNDPYRRREESGDIEEPPVKEERPITKEDTSFSEKLKKLADRERLSHLFEYANNNVRETVSYALLTLGILLLFAIPFLGQALIGIVIAIYFGGEILNFFFDYDKYIHELGIPRSIIIAGALLALCILAPFVFIGIAAMIIFRYLMHDQLPKK